MEAISNGIGAFREPKSRNAGLTLLAMAGISAGGLPQRMAEINEVLNALPVPLRERLLVEYLNGLFRQPGDT